MLVGTDEGNPTVFWMQNQKTAILYLRDLVVAYQFFLEIKAYMFMG